MVPREYAAGADLPPLIPVPYWSTMLTSMFLHGGWGHLGGNMLFLWIFGDNIEHRLGHVRFVIFYLACGLAASLAHIVFNSGSIVPAVGASGAISGVLGGYLLMFPRNRVYVLTWVGVDRRAGAVHARALDRDAVHQRRRLDRRDRMKPAAAAWPTWRTSAVSSPVSCSRRCWRWAGAAPQRTYRDTTAGSDR